MHITLEGGIIFFSKGTDRYFIVLISDWSYGEPMLTFIVRLTGCERRGLRVGCTKVDMNIDKFNGVLVAMHCPLRPIQPLSTVQFIYILE